MTIVIAEIGQAHDGSLGILHSLIDGAAAAGVDAVKFQTHIARAESSPFEPFRIPFSFEDATRFDYWRRMEFTPEQWGGVRDHCLRAGVAFVSSPFSVAAVELLEPLQPAFYKIGSGEVGNLLMLERITRTGRRMVLSSGLSTFDELDRTVAFLRQRQADLAILQCSTKYPTTAMEVGLNVMAEIRHRFGCPTGLSDHSGAVYPGLAAATLGADYIEVHITFDKRMFGPDSRSSLTLDELAVLVRGVREIETMLSHPVDKLHARPDPAIKNMFGKSLAVNRDLPEGSLITLYDLESKKPGDRGIESCRFEEVANRRLKRSLSAWEFLQWSDLENG